MCLVIIYCFLLCESPIKLLILVFLVMSLVWQFFLGVSILTCDFFLPRCTFGHLLHVVVVVFHERSHRKIDAFDSTVLIFILVDLISFVLVKDHFVFLIQLELRVVVILITYCQKITFIYQRLQGREVVHPPFFILENP